MKIMPIEKLTLISELSKSEVIEVLNSNIRPRQIFGFGNQNAKIHKRFEGTMFGDNFNVTRVINYRNSFLPEANGKIIEKSNGTEIEIELKPVSFVMVFMIIWLVGVSFAFITTLTGAIINEDPLNVCLFPLGMLMIGLGILKFGFTSEIENTKNDMIEILKAKVK